MASKEETFKAVAVTPPPRRRASKGPTLSKDFCEEMLAAMKVKGEDGEYPWISNGKTYPKENQCSAQLLRFRKAFVAHGLVTSEEITGTSYSTSRDPETGAKKLDDNGKEIGPFAFALKVKEPETEAAE